MLSWTMKVLSSRAVGIFLRCNQSNSILLIEGKPWDLQNVSQHCFRTDSPVYPHFSFYTPFRPASTPFSMPPGWRDAICPTDVFWLYLQGHLPENFGPCNAHYLKQHTNRLHFHKKVSCLCFMWCIHRPNTQVLGLWMYYTILLLYNMVYYSILFLP